MPNLAAVDWMILLIYFFFTISIGLGLKQNIVGSADYLLAGRGLPAWLGGLALAGASLGSLEILGMGAAGAQFGPAAIAAFAVGAVLPLVFAGLWMMPFYRGARPAVSRSVAEYLGLRFDEKTRVLAAVLTAVISIVAAALALYAMARVSAALHLFDVMFHAEKVGSQGILLLSIALPAALVLIYVALGGLTATMYSQVMQLFVLVVGFLPVVFFGLKQAGGWGAVQAGLSAAALGREWHGMNPGGLAAMAIAAGVGLVLTAGYWCTDQSVLQSAMAMEDPAAARRVPLIAAAMRVVLAFVLVVPGIIAASLPTPHSTTTMRVENGEIFHEINVVPRAAEEGQGLVPARTDSLTDPMEGKPLHDTSGRVLLDYGLATPNLLPHSLPTGLLGLVLTALLACLTGGVAGRVSAFATVFTNDLYRTSRRKDAEDKELLKVGRWAGVGAVALSALPACMLVRVHGMPGILELLAMALALLNAPMLMTLVLGMFWKRATAHGAFAGLIAGYMAAIAYYGLTLPAGAQRGIAGGWIAVWHQSTRGIAQSFWTAVIAMAANLVVTVAVSAVTEASETASRQLSKPAGERVGVQLDLRIPMGMMFSMAGAVLMAFGLATRNRPEFFAKSLGINGDLWWGGVVLTFGLIVLTLGRRGQGRIEQGKRGGSLPKKGAKKR